MRAANATHWSPRDVSDYEWAFVGPYLMLIDPSAPPWEHSLREPFNSLRYIVRSGATWRMMPNALPPWGAVSQQAQRWYSENHLATYSQQGTSHVGSIGGSRT